MAFLWGYELESKTAMGKDWRSDLALVCGLGCAMETGWVCL